MRGLSFLREPTIRRIPVIMKDIHEGELLFPLFQRGFVWSDEQRLQLLDSIYRGVPIGSVLVWRTRSHRLSCFNRSGNRRVHFTGVDEGNDIRQYLLDGMQRLTTLYTALGPGLSNESETIEPEAADETDSTDLIPIFFNLEKQAFELKPRRGDVPDTWLPLNILLDPFRLYKFQKTLADKEEGRRLVNRAENLAAIFKDYSIPVVPIVTEDLNHVTTSFQRINSSGTRLTEFHMVNALTWNTSFDLTEKVSEIQSDIGDMGWNIEEKIILNACKLALNLNLYETSAEELSKELKDQPEIIDETKNNLVTAIKFLESECNVFGVKILPSVYQLILITDAFRVSSNNTSEVRNALKRWFWITSYTEYFTGMSGYKTRGVIKYIRKIAVLDEDPMPEDAIQTVTPLDRFNFRTARSKAFAVRMAELAPPKNNPVKNLRLIAEQGVNAVPKLITGHKLDWQHLDGPENRIIASPRKIKALRESILNNPQTLSGSFMDRYTINKDAADFLRSKDYIQFLYARKQEIDEIEHDFVISLGLKYEQGHS